MHISKGVFLIFLAFFTFGIIGCSQNNELQDVFEEMKISPDVVVKRCDELSQEDNRQLCYGMYLTAKAEQGEQIDGAICAKIKNEETKDGCKIYQLAVEKKDKEDLMRNLNEELSLNPDEAVKKCSSLSADLEQVCYSAYLGSKAEKGEPIDKEVCSNIFDIKVREGCLAYAKTVK